MAIEFGGFALSQAPRARKSNPWIFSSAGIAIQAERDVNSILLDSLELMNEDLKKLSRKEGVGASVRRAQLLSSRSVMNNVLHKMFLSVRNVIKARQAEAASIAADLGIREEKEAWKIIEPNKKQRDEAVKDLKIQAARQIQATMKAANPKYELSERVWKSEALAKGQVHRAVLRNIAVGASVDDMAKELKDLVRPSTPGGVSSRARLLARTEVNNAFHAQSQSDIKSKPWIKEARWNLSKSHSERVCKCDMYAEIEVFPAEKIPDRPHPGCMCVITPVIRSLAEIEKELQARKYAGYLKEMV